jgi:hypothetical protein
VGRTTCGSGVILGGDEIFTKVGGYVLGNFLTSVIASTGGRLARGSRLDF